MKETAEVKTSVLMKKLRLQYAIGFGRQEKDRIQNLLNVGRSVLKLEEIMWKSDYARLSIKVKHIFIFLLHLNSSLSSFFI